MPTNAMEPKSSGATSDNANCANSGPSSVEQASITAAADANNCTKIAQSESALEKARALLFAYSDNEITAHPWWAVVRTKRKGPAAIVAGPFFSRERAESYRQQRMYEHGKDTIVYCFSGHNSQHYRDLREALGKKGDR